MKNRKTDEKNQRENNPHKFRTANDEKRKRVERKVSRTRKNQAISLRLS